MTPPNTYSSSANRCTSGDDAWDYGVRFAESIAAFAQPSGTTVRPVYESLRGELLADLRAAGEVDIVLLTMHGAMVAEGYDDCEEHTSEGERPREEDTIIGVELDHTVVSRKR